MHSRENHQKLDTRMKFLPENNPMGANHPAVKQYNKCMRGAGDTVRSIIISREFKTCVSRKQTGAASPVPKHDLESC